MPIPTFPFASMMKAVEVAEAVEVETTNSGMRAELVEVAPMERIAQGVEVPIPTC